MKDLNEFAKAFKITEVKRCVDIFNYKPKEKLIKRIVNFLKAKLVPARWGI